MKDVDNPLKELEWFKLLEKLYKEKYYDDHDSKE